MTNELSGPTQVDVSFRPQDLHVEVTVSHARAHLPELLDDVRAGELVYLTRYGKRLAALVPAEAAERLAQQDDAYWSDRAKAARNSEGDPIPWERVVADLEADPGLAGVDG
jgi:prevent-host-death family protein